MRYAISYVSTAKSNLTEDDIKNLLEIVTEKNNSQDITGLLLASDSNFFQLIEGEEKKVKELYSHIEKDQRHTNIIKIVDKPVVRPAYDGYIGEVVTPETKFDASKLKNYLNHIEVLDPTAKKAVTGVIEAIIF